MTCIGRRSDRVRLHPDGEIELDLRIDPARLAAAVLACEEDAEHRARIDVRPCEMEPACPAPFAAIKTLGSTGKILYCPEARAGLRSICQLEES